MRYNGDISANKVTVIYYVFLTDICCGTGTIGIAIAKVSGLVRPPNIQRCVFVDITCSL